MHFVLISGVLVFKSRHYNRLFCCLSFRPSTRSAQTHRYARFWPRFKPTLMYWRSPQPGCPVVPRSLVLYNRLVDIWRQL